MGGFFLFPPYDILESMFYLFLFFGLGLIIGSFLNVVLLRTEREESYVEGRSHCDACDASISWYDNIPVVSYIMLQGKCRACEKEIPKVHLWMELATGVSFALVGLICFDILSPESWFTTLWMLILVSFLILIVVSDFATMEIPFSFLVASNMITFLYLILYYVLFEQGITFWQSDFWGSLLGGFISWIFFFSLVYFSKETWMGWGDVWIGLLAGLVVGKGLVLIMLTLSFGSGALYGVYLLMKEGKNLKTAVPFAPFLVFGMLATFFLMKCFPSLFQFFLW
jgi:prepilin signal peptidase PulO-like enzyme (type II secretory pathway)